MPEPPLGECALPDKPSLERLKHEAKRRLQTMRLQSPEAKLADAQFQLARAYGFASWRALKGEIDSRADDAGAVTIPSGRYGRYVGCYLMDPSISTNTVLEITEDDGRLFAQSTGGIRSELVEGDGGAFVHPGLPGRYVFTGDETRPATGLIAHGERGSHDLPRTTQAKADAAQAAYARALVRESRPRTAIPVQPDIHGAYVGHYLSPAGPSLEITLTGERMFIRLAGQPPLQIFPETDTDFFLRVTPAQLGFVRAAGKVTGLVLHQNGRGQPMARVSAEAAAKASASIVRRAAEQLQPRTAIKIDPAILGRYVGRYQSSLNLTRVFVVTAENGRLFIKVGEEDRYEVYPETERDFFWTVSPTQISFITDATGRANLAICRQFGRDLPLMRIDTEEGQP